MTRIAIIGVGAIARIHARSIGDLAGVELVGASCRTEAKGRQFVGEFGGEWCADYRDLLDRTKPDVVTICTPSGAHLEPAVAALECGVHVLCEKPLEVDLDRARRMIDAARRSGARLAGVFPQRFNPVVAKAHQAASAGRLGSLAAATAIVPWWRDDAYYAPSRWQGTKSLDGGGALINQSIHAIDTVQWLAAAAGAGDVVEVSGITALRGHDPALVEVEDTAVATLRFAHGGVGVLLGSTAMWPGTAMRVHLAGRDGTIEVHEKELVTWRFRDESPDDAATRARFARGDGAGGAADPMAIDYSNHTRNLDDFLRSIAAGKPSAVEPEEAWKALAIVRAVYESAGTGRPQPVATL
jgi:predicted dehydrogenase